MSVVYGCERMTTPQETRSDADDAEPFEVTLRRHLDTLQELEWEMHLLVWLGFQEMLGKELWLLTKRAAINVQNDAAEGQSQ